MSLGGRGGNPASRHGGIPDVPGKDERKHYRGSEHHQVKEGQLALSRPEAEAFSKRHVSAFKLT